MPSVLDLIAAAVLGLLMTGAMFVTPISRSTEQAEAMTRFSSFMQTYTGQADSTSVTTGTPGLDDNDGKTILVSPSARGTGSTTVSVYQSRPVGSLALPPPHQEQFDTQISVNGDASATPYALFIAPNKSVTLVKGWTYGQGTGGAGACASVTFTTGTTIEGRPNQVPPPTVSLDCTTSTVTGPF